MKLSVLQKIGLGCGLIGVAAVLIVIVASRPTGEREIPYSKHVAVRFVPNHPARVYVDDHETNNGLVFLRWDHTFTIRAVRDGYPDIVFQFRPERYAKGQIVSFGWKD